MHYLDLLRRLHEELRPAGYLEIGVDWGDSLGLSRARSVAIDPAPKPRPETLLGKPGLVIYVGTSDDFFREHERETMLRDAPLDLAFIDGLHEFAQVVRDLENVERWGHPDTVVAIHDVLPRNAWEAAHAFHDGFWTGDVWRIVPFLRKHRPDLRLWLTRADPTGMLIVTGLDPGHPGMAHLAEAEDAVSPPAGPEYDRLVESFIAEADAVPAEEIIRAIGLGRRLERDWEYKTKWGMRLVAESSWRPLLDAAAALPHTNRHRDGLRACLRLIGAHWLPDGVREEAYRHATWYAEPLAALWPDATWQVLSLPGADPGSTRSSAPALVADELVVAVQAATVDRDAFAWTLLEVDPELHVRSAAPLRDATGPGMSAPVLASVIEHMHPFVHDGRLLAFVASRDGLPFGKTKTGLASIEQDALRDLRWLVGPWRGGHGEGWAPLPTPEGLHAVASWEPTEILRVDPGSGESCRVALRPATRLTERFRASSAAVAVPGGYLVLINEETGSSGDGQPVLARFVFLRSDFRVAGVSPHFWVTARGGDVAGGLARAGDDLIAAVTSRGNQTLLLRVPVAAVLGSLFPVTSAADVAPDVSRAGSSGSKS